MAKRRIILVLVCLVVVGVAGCGRVVDSAANAKLKQNFGKVSVTVYPTFVWRVGGPVYDRASAKDIAGYLETEGMASVKTSEQRACLAGKLHMVQWKLFKQSLRLFQSYLKDNPIDTDYALLAEYLITPVPSGGQAAGGIHCYLLDADGRVALAVLLNSHHKVFAEAKPKTTEDCTTVLIKALGEQLGDKKD